MIHVFFESYVKILNHFEPKVLFENVARLSGTKLKETNSKKKF
jgi:hypothetical protein